MVEGPAVARAGPGARDPRRDSPGCSPVGRPDRRVAAGLNRALAPGRLEFDELRALLVRPDPARSGHPARPQGGDRSLKVASAVLDQTLGQWTPARVHPTAHDPDPGRGLARRPSGRRTARSTWPRPSGRSSPTPTPGGTSRSGSLDGSLRYRRPLPGRALGRRRGRPGPSGSPPRPSPVTWSLRSSTEGNSNLESRATSTAGSPEGRPSPRAPELQVGVVGKRWPIRGQDRRRSTPRAGSTARSTSPASEADGSSRAMPGSIGLRARGKILSGDTLAFDRLDAGWDLAEGEEGWTIRRLSA